LNWQFVTVTFVRPVVFEFVAAGAPAVATDGSALDEKP